MIAIIYLAFTIVLCVMYEQRIKGLEKRVELLECLFGEVEKNEVDDQ